MKTQLRDLIADALYEAKSYMLPAICERYGLDAGDKGEAFSSKRKYVMTRLARLSDEQVFDAARKVVRDFPDDRLVAAVEQIEKDGHLITDITRKHLAAALDGVTISGSEGLIEFLRKHRPTLEFDSSVTGSFTNMADELTLYSVTTNAWSSSQVLGHIGFFKWSQTKLFSFLSDVLHPIRRSAEEQAALVEKLNPILQRDGYLLRRGELVSGYPTFKVQEIGGVGARPADELISQTLMSFDEMGVHQAWERALERRASDSEGAITAAKTLLETVCKHILDEANFAYGANDDLPKLYGLTSDLLNLAPSQHSETVFKSILGNCHSVVSNLAGLRNKLGDSHGQGKRHVKPQARHAELAVNLAGTMAMFLISTWNARSS